MKTEILPHALYFCEVSLSGGSLFFLHHFKLSSCPSLPLSFFFLHKFLSSPFPFHPFHPSLLISFFIQTFPPIYRVLFIFFCGFPEKNFILKTQRINFLWICPPNMIWRLHEQNWSRQNEWYIDNSNPNLLHLKCNIRMTIKASIDSRRSSLENKWP